MAVIDQSPILFFKAEGQAAALGHTYYTISKQTYRIQAGDVLEYEVYIDKISSQLQAGVDLYFQNGKALREYGVTDQLGTSSHPWVYVLDAGDSWFHRKFDLSKIAGETIASCELSIVGSLLETYFMCVANIRIIRNGAVVCSFYEKGDPACLENKMREGFGKEVILPILWKDYRATKLNYIDATKLSPEIQTARLIQKLLPERAEEWQKLLTEAEAQLDVSAYLAGDDAQFKVSIEKIQQTLAPLLTHSKAFTTHLIGHAHIDMNWLWVWDETVDVLRRDFETMTKLMEEYPMFRYSHSQAVTYKVIEKNYPDLFLRVQKYVNKKQWEITASMWTEGDENLTSGEALVRQFLLGKRYIMEKFGVEPVVCWQPDLFGHVWTMPQIIKKCGAKYYFFMRCPKENTTAFWWQGPDGSKVLAYNTPNYNGSINPAIATYPIQLFKQEGVSHYLHSYGVGDHGGGPTRKDIEASLEMQQNLTTANIKFDTVEGFFESLLKSDSQHRPVELPVVNDELQFIFRGCYTTHADIKLRNRQCENLFPTLEFFSLMAMPYELAYPKFILDEGWERTCFNHFHDILPGSGIHAAYQESLPITDGAIAAGEAALDRSLQIIAEQIKTDIIPDKKPLVVFNACNWDRSDLAQIEVPLLANEWIEIWDPEERLIPCQITNRASNCATLLFIAENVPSMGYKTYWWRKVAKQPELESDLLIKDDTTFENEFYQMKIDPETGCLTSLVEKVTQREYLESDKGANQLQLHYETPAGMSAWVIGQIERVVELSNPVQIKILETGPVRALIQIVHRYEKSEFIQRIALYSKLKRIDFPGIVDWYEQGMLEKSGPMLKVAFPLAVQKDQVTATYEIPFGHIVRETDGKDVPALKWIDVSDQECGVSLLNDCKHGHDVKDNVMRLTLLRSSFEPDQEPDQGRHYFTYALLPHSDSWKAAGSERVGRDLNQPLRAVLVQPRDGKMPLTESFVTTSAPNVIISAFKKAEDNADPKRLNEMVLRFYETHGKEVEVEFKFAFEIESVVETDMLERELENGTIPHQSRKFSTSLTPFEIKTVRIQTPKFAWPVRHEFVPV